MEKYKEYKDSGVQWLGEIPSHWKTRRIKWLFREEDEKNVNLSYQLLSFSRNKGIIPFSAINEKAPSASDLSKYKVLHVGQLLENRMQAWSGMFGCSHIEGCVSPDYSVFSPYDSSVLTEYYACLFRTPIFVQQFANASKGIGDGFNRLYTPQFQRICAIAPPTIEQHSIVSYLDTKCSLLDTLLSNKEKQISLLQEMKQRVIADAVTRGVNPNIKFKATNIPWLPEIPEHWKIKPIRSLLREVTEKSETGEEELLSLSQYTGISYKKDAKNTGMFDAESTIGYKKVYPGQFVMNIMLAWNGSYAVSGLQGIISPAYCVFDFVSDCDKLYYHYLLRLGIYSGAFKTASRGIIDSRLRLYPNRFYPFPIICPPIDEQKAIVSYITERTSKIDTLIEKLTKEIECVKEYKQRLISDVVTGQVKVC